MPDTSVAPYTLPSAIPTEAFSGGGTLLLWIFFWFGFVITIAFGFALLYHWFRYGFMYPLAIAAIPVYSIGVLVLIGAMLAGISGM